MEIGIFTGDYFMETTNSNYFGTEKISRILLKIAPPVMLAQLIQALYNIVDSLFVGKYSESGLTALSIIYPLQLLMIAIAVGTGVGINTAMAHYLGIGDRKKAEEYGGIGTPLTLVLWVLFALICFLFMPAYARMSTDSPEVIRDVTIYGRIVCVSSIGGKSIARSENGRPAKIPSMIGLVMIPRSVLPTRPRWSACCASGAVTVSTSTEKMLYSGTLPRIMRPDMPEVP